VVASSQSSAKNKNQRRRCTAVRQRGVSLLHIFSTTTFKKVMTAMTTRQPIAPKASRRHRRVDDFVMKGWDADDVGRACLGTVEGRRCAIETHD